MNDYLTHDQVGFMLKIAAIIIGIGFIKCGIDHIVGRWKK